MLRVLSLTSPIAPMVAVMAAVALRLKKSPQPDPLVQPAVAASRNSSPTFSRWLDDHPPSRRVLLGFVIAFVCGGYLGVLLGISDLAPAPPAPPAPELLSLTPLASTSFASTSFASTSFSPTSSAGVSETTADAPLIEQPLPQISVEAAKPTLASPPPSADIQTLTSDEMIEVQAWLKAFGFDPGPLDGMRGPQTVAAVKRYQAARRKEETGLLDRSLLQQVRQQAGHSGR